MLNSGTWGQTTERKWELEHLLPTGSERGNQNRAAGEEPQQGLPQTVGQGRHLETLGALISSQRSFFRVDR